MSHQEIDLHIPLVVIDKNKIVENKYKEISKDVCLVSEIYKDLNTEIETQHCSIEEMANRVDAIYVSVNKAEKELSIAKSYNNHTTKLVCGVCALMVTISCPSLLGLKATCGLVASIAGYGYISTHTS